MAASSEAYTDGSVPRPTSAALPASAPTLASKPTPGPSAWLFSFSYSMLFGEYDSYSISYGEEEDGEEEDARSLSPTMAASSEAYTDGPVPRPTSAALPASA